MNGLQQFPFMVLGLKRMPLKTQQCKGSALFITLVMLVILTGFGVTLLTLSQWEEKANHGLQNQANLRTLGLMAMDAIEKPFREKGKKGFACVRKKPLGHSPIRWTDAQWKVTKSCLLKSSQSKSQFIIEPISSDPCGQLGATQQAVDAKNGVIYYRITGRVQPIGLQHNILLQSTVALPSKKSEICNGVFFPVQSPHQSLWIASGIG